MLFILEKIGSNCYLNLSRVPRRFFYEFVWLIFLTNSWRMFWRIFRRIFWRIFRRIFRRIFDEFFWWIFLMNFLTYNLWTIASFWIGVPSILFSPVSDNIWKHCFITNICKFISFWTFFPWSECLHGNVVYLKALFIRRSRYKSIGIWRWKCLAYPSCKLLNRKNSNQYYVSLHDMYKIFSSWAIIQWEFSHLQLISRLQQRLQQGMIDAENSAKWVDINSEGAILYYWPRAVIVTTFSFSSHAHACIRSISHVGWFN